MVRVALTSILRKMRVPVAAMSLGLLVPLTGCPFFVCQKSSCTDSTTSSTTGDYAYVSNSASGTTYLDGFQVSGGSLVAATGFPLSLGYVPAAMVAVERVFGERGAAAGQQEELVGASSPALHVRPRIQEFLIRRRRLALRTEKSDASRLAIVPTRRRAPREGEQARRHFQRERRRLFIGRACAGGCLGRVPDKGFIEAVRGAEPGQFAGRGPIEAIDTGLAASACLRLRRPQGGHGIDGVAEEGFAKSGGGKIGKA